ncbi:sulfite exporter TauE/SafE family protein [Chachezhania antarctica]|mgnify:FL=1|uniref:sulfite exporter TauE/SafE family protein n=1 Tax=Chachezhania antarctica TaxID=2340860 RepID=UPI000EAD1EBC|nr:sulfite exporter TauE/SafE family protein [Chachezhania antarctica]
METFLPWPETGLICLSVLMAALLRGLTGFGFALAAVPAMSFFLPPQQAVTMAVLLQCMAGLKDSVTLRGTWHGPVLKRLVLGAAVGTPFGVALLLLLDPTMLRIGIAVMILIGLALLVWQPKTGLKPPSMPLALVTGATAGFVGGFAAMPGPPAVAYFLTTDIPARQVRASLIIFFFTTSALALPGLVWGGLVTVQTVAMALVSLPLMLVGTWVGGLLFKRTSETGFRRLAMLVLLATAIASGARGMAGIVG